MSKRKLITDFTLVKVLLDFESDAMRVFKNVPAKYRYTHEKEFFDAVACTIRLAVKSMDTPPTDSTLLRQKYYMLTEAHSELCKPWKIPKTSEPNRVAVRNNNNT